MGCLELEAAPEVMLRPWDEERFAVFVSFRGTPLAKESLMV